MSQKILNYIGGEFTEPASSQFFETLNPATDEVLAKVARSFNEDIDNAVRIASEGFIRGDWRLRSPEERAEVLLNIADLIDENLQPLAELESRDTGKPISETLNGDIPRAASNFRTFAKLVKLDNFKTFEGPANSSHHVSRQPIGVCALITPWNLPLYLETWKIAPPLAMGNSIVLKPAELTPCSANALAEIISQTNLPPGTFNVVHGFGENEAGQALVEHPDVACISFTGETTTGSAIMKSASRSLKKLSFELGGKGASVVFADAALEKAAETSLRAAFRNQGQICLAGSRLIVEESVAPEFVDLLCQKVRSIKVGDPSKNETEMGALVSREHRDKVLSYVDYAKGNGYEILCGGSVPFNEGAFLEPTVIKVNDQNSKLIQEEIFGPVLTIQTFNKESQALTYLNGTPYGLSCSIWTGDKLRAKRFASQAQFGMIWINGWFVRNLETPFGGVKRSGIGREGGQYSLDFFSEYKTVSFCEE